MCNSSIDTIVETADGSSYVFKGDHYWMLAEGGVAPGYPRIIAQDWPGLPSNIDAAVTWKIIGNTYFSKETNSGNSQTRTHPLDTPRKSPTF